MDKVYKTTAVEEDTLDHGSIIDAQGNEVQITEQMIQQACAVLAEQLPNHYADAAERTCY